MQSLLQFTRHLGNHWLAFVTGSVVLGVVALLERLVKPLPTYVYVIVVLLGGLVCASFDAWRDEHQAVLTDDITIHGLNRQIRDLQGQIMKLAQPIIQGDIRQRFVMSANTPTGLPQMEVLEVAVTNSGAPTVLTNWNLTIQSGTAITPAINCVMPEELEGTAPLGMKVRIPRKYMLQEITSNSIERGGMRTGWLVFEMQPTFSLLLHKGSSLYVSANDAFGHTFIIRYVLKADTRPITLQDMLTYSPGSGQIFYVPSPTPSPAPIRHQHHRN